MSTLSLDSFRLVCVCCRQQVINFERGRKQENELNVHTIITAERVDLCARDCVHIY